MSVDATTLRDSLTGLKGIFDQISTDLGTGYTTCLTPIEPGADCEVVHLWPQTINTQRLGACEVAAEVVVSWRVTVCVGSDTQENCEWWTERTPTVLDTAWGYYGGLILAYTDGTLCPAILSRCQDTRFDPVNPVPSGDYVAYQGAIRYVLGVAQATS